MLLVLVECLQTLSRAHRTSFLPWPLHLGPPASGTQAVIVLRADHFNFGGILVFDGGLDVDIAQDHPRVIPMFQFHTFQLRANYCSGNGLPQIDDDVAVAVGGDVDVDVYVGVNADVDVAKGEFGGRR